MARPITTIYQEIIDSKNAREELSDLNSTSQVAIYKLWAYVISVAIYTHELLWDLFKEDIESTLDSRINGTNEWYSQKALEYQDGDELLLLDDGTRLGYDPVLEDNRIVTRAAYFEDLIGAKGRLNLKLAKGDVASLEELSTEEKGRITQYFERIKFAGTNINIISIQPDEIELTDITVYHDGVKTDDEIRSAVESAMDNYLVNLPFNGVFYIESFRDAIQAVDNIVDVYIVRLDRTEYSSGSGVSTQIVRKATLDAGYAIIADYAPLNIEIES
jgi:hypothetical protein